MPTAAAGAWLAGAAWVAPRNGMRIRRWRRKLACGPPAPEWLTILVRELADPMRLRPPRLVVLPAGVADGLGLRGAGCDLAARPGRSPIGGRTAGGAIHELAHVRRRDDWVGWLLLAAGCVWWWHPLFWWVRRKLTQEAELACDAGVSGRRPTRGGPTPRRCWKSHSGWLRRPPSPPSGRRAAVANSKGEWS